MSRDDRAVEEGRCGADVAAYALGALDPADAAAFEGHLNSCAVCPYELATVEQVVNCLPMSAPPCPAPPGLRRRVLALVAPQAEPPSTRLRRPKRTGWRRPQRTGWRPPRGTLALGTALGLAAAALAGLDLPRTGSTAVRVIGAEVNGEGTAQLRVTGDHARLVVHRFSPPPAGEIYEVWLEYPRRPAAPTSALFSVTAAGDGEVEVPGSIHGVSQVMVSPEPSGGTRVPTHAAVLRANLA